MASRKIGPYRIEDKLGAGGMGEVFRAYDDRLDRWIAIKLIRPDALASVEARRRFRREARAAARLSHPAIVQIHDILESEDGDSIVMELVEGRPLSALLAEGRLGIGRALAMAREIAEGLAEAHAKEIVHRDLKADNVMVTSAGRVKILDFGLAKRLSQSATDLSIEGRILGTVHAMSPEQAQGFEVDHRSDLFSLGSLLYQAVTGRAPFLGDSPVGTLARIATFRPPSAREVNPEVPEALSRLIDRLLEKDPVHRPRTAAEVAAALAGLAADRESSGSLGAERRDPRSGDSLSAAPTLAGPPAGTEDRPEDATAEAGVPATRRRAGVVAVSLLLSLLAALGSWTWLSRDPEPLHAAVQRPRILSAAETQDPELVASAVRLALIQALLSCRGVSTPDPDEVDTVSGSAAQMARALGVDEVVTSSLVCSARTCKIVLRRIGVDGSVLWTDDLEADPEDLLDLSAAVAQRLLSGYPGYEARPGAIKTAVAPEDYEAYLRLYRSWQTRTEGVSPDELLEAVTALESRSPRFADAYLLEARIAQARYSGSRQPADLERALAAARRAREVAPGDSRVLLDLFNVAYDGGRFEEAEEALRGLRVSEPGHGRIMALEALLLEGRGQSAEALGLMRQAARRHASWHNLMDLARMEVRLGEKSAARNRLRELLERSPENFLALFQLARHEMTYGRLEEALELFERLRLKAPSDPGTRLNIALACFGLARYEEAARWYRGVLELQPSHLPAMSALALTELLRSDSASAREHGASALALAAATSGVGEGELYYVRAMALVALGQDEQAVAAVQRFLSTAHDGPFAAWQAALIYAAVDQEISARANAREALRQGLTPQWFTAPLFDFLKEDPGLRNLLEVDGGAPD